MTRRKLGSAGALCKRQSGQCAGQRARLAQPAGTGFAARIVPTFEEGVQQKIEVFESKRSLPLDPGSMIDSSLSAHKEIAFEQGGCRAFHPPSAASRGSSRRFRGGESVTPIGRLSDNVATLQAAVRRMPTTPALRFMTRSCWLLARWSGAARIAAG